MPLGTQLEGALKGPIEFVMANFSVNATLRRRTNNPANDGPDGSPSNAVTQYVEPVRIVATRAAKIRLQRKWGQTTEAEIDGIVETEEQLQMGDFLKPLSGDLAGLWLEIVELGPVAFGRITELGLRAVPEPLPVVP